MAIDLHIHSVASDGLHTPGELLAMAAAANLTAVAIADHDSVESVDEALASADEFGVEVVPALELSSHIDHRDVHFLGYYLDHHSKELSAHLKSLRDARVTRAGDIVRRLNDYGIDVTLEELLALAGDGAVGRAHIGTLLVQRGHATSVSDAFRRYLQRGACCYVEKEVMATGAIVSLIRGLGGIPVLAHPGVSRIDSQIEHLVDEGLQGIEAFHADHTLEQIRDYRDLAGRLGLVVTGGSDFHGASVRGIRVGAIDVPDWVLEDLKRLHRDG